MVKYLLFLIIFALTVLAIVLPKNMTKVIEYVDYLDPVEDELEVPFYPCEDVKCP